MLVASPKSKTEFLAALDLTTNEAAAILHDELERELESLTDKDFTAAEWNKVVDFALDQLSQWQVKWLFSSSQAPDTKAQTETKEWELLWRRFSQALGDKVPGIEEQLRRKKDLLIAQRLLERKTKQDSGSRGAMFASSTMSSLAITLNQLGYRSIAQRLYKRALYPSGTVGRAKD